MSNKEELQKFVKGWSKLMSVVFNPDGSFKAPELKNHVLSDESISKIYDIIENELESGQVDCNHDCANCEHNKVEEESQNLMEKLREKKFRTKGFRYAARWVVSATVFNSDDGSCRYHTAHLVSDKSRAAKLLETVMGEIITKYGNVVANKAKSGKKIFFQNEDVNGVVKMSRVRVNDTEHGSMVV